MIALRQCCWAGSGGKVGMIINCITSVGDGERDKTLECLMLPQGSTGEISAKRAIIFHISDF